MANRAPDWVEQAEHDLEHARRSRDMGDHEWACFAAQQAAEKAVKGLHFHIRQEPPWSHSIRSLLDALRGPDAVPEALRQQAQTLDNFYIPARYPDSHPEGAPAAHYSSLQSELAIECAGSILAFVRSEMA